MGIERHIRGNTNAPSGAHNILENLIPDIPVEPDVKKKRNRKEKK